MVTFNAAGKAPGVYMQEIEVPGPIAGVSTGVAAIIGPAKSGPLNTPTFVTNWTQFTEVFGGYIDAPVVYAPMAVRGFFENGGAVCCFVRAGVARQSAFAVVDRSDERHPVFTIKAKEEGKQGDKIKVAIKEGSLCQTTARKCSANLEQLSEDRMTLRVGSADDASLFVPGDLITVTQGGRTEEGEVAMISAMRKEIILKAGLVKAFSMDEPEQVTVRLADLQNKKRLRLSSVNGLEPGSYLMLSQEASSGGETLVDYAVVETLDGNSVLLRSPLTKAFSLSANEEIEVCSQEFTLEITDGDTPEATVRIYENLSVVPYHSRYYEKHIPKSSAVLIEPADPPNPSLPPLNMPDPGYAGNSGALSGGEDDNPKGLTYPHYREAIDALEKASVNIVCAPDATGFGSQDNAVLLYLADHCRRMGDRFAILDCAYNLSVSAVLGQRELLGDTSYAAFYYPWIEIPNPSGTGRVKVPPSGYIAGVYARTDDAKGVHKAPGNEYIQGCYGPSAILNDTEHGMLNEVAVNAIMSIPGSGTALMGARTLSQSTQWRYINVRRLLLYIEKSIQEATRFAVFQPNNLSLWATIKRQVNDFLSTVWRSGALFGATPDQAFMVKVDEELNPPSIRALGQLVIEVVLYPVTPAEYIVFRIIQQPGGAEVAEAAEGE